jgi:murein DD-endopeptidase MepM/ murein hydrolase activator NlpD
MRVTKRQKGKRSLRLRFGARRTEPRPFYTILILPHSRSRFRKLQLSRAFVLTLAGLALALAAAGLYAPNLFFKTETQSAVLEQLREENARLLEERLSFETALGEISEQVSGVENRTGRLAEELGVDDLAGDEPAAGGPAPPGARRSLFDQEVNALRSRADSLGHSMDQLDEVFRERMRLLASTPNTMPVQGWFSHGFGWRKDPFDGRRQFHRGIDIVADSGTPIQAPADGVVSRAVRVADYGKTIDISHGYGYVTRYAHLAEILVRPGQRVKRGDVIGKIGSSGRSTGPHLHYEVFRDGRRVNPWKYLGQRGS